MKQYPFNAPGIAPRWKTRKSIVKHLAQRQDRTEERIAKISSYNFRSDGNPDNFVLMVSGDYKVAGLDNFRTAIGLALDAHSWLGKASFATAYRLLGCQLEFYARYRFDLCFPDHPQKFRKIGLLDSTDSLACAFLLGWSDAAIHQGYLAHAALNRQYNLVFEYQEEHRRAAAFMLRLFADWRGDVHHDWPPYAYDEPIYEAVLADWRNPDPQVLVPALLAACDRHTHEARYDGGVTKFYDFYDDYLMRTPLEILMAFRLRELLGLENPVLDHPLMEAPFDRLPDPQPLYAPDDLMLGTLARIRQDWPDFDAAVSLESLKA